MTATPARRLLTLCNCGVSHGPNRNQGLNRRDLLIGGAATVALGAATWPGFIARAAAQTKPDRIDVHHHISPPASGFFKAEDLKAVDRENALRLVPRFKAT